MKKIDADDPLTSSPDVAATNLDRLRDLFPDAFTEGKVDFDVLRQLLGDAVDDSDEKYGLNWHGKRRARQLALTPSTGTLRPCPEESVDWDTTQNLMIEGDNLEVLKLLQKSYAGKVKLIYIDPPYNTGKDFVYRDNYRDPLADYRRRTGQTDAADARLTSNLESSGRFHTHWLNMLYPRLHLARSLLSLDGAVFVSIDERELPNLRLMLDDIFGQENLVSTFTIRCNPRGRAQDKHFATTHEYVVCCSRTPLGKGSFGVPKDPRQIAAEYRESDSRGRFRYLELRNTHREFGKHNRKNLYYPLFAAADGTVSVDRDEGHVAVYPDWSDGYQGCWTWGRRKAGAESEDLVAREVRGRLKIFVKDRADGATRMLKTLFLDTSYATDKGQRVFNELFETKEKIFPSPKSPYLRAEFISSHTEDGDLVLDFFAGSGTCAHAVMQQNARDMKRRRFLVVQIAEATDRADYPSIADITQERIRRAGRKVAGTDDCPAADFGFRVFKLDTSNLRPWNPGTTDLDGELLASLDHIEPGRSEQDLLYELLLKLGLDLSAPIETRTIAGNRVYAVGAGSLLACLERRIGGGGGARVWPQELPTGGTSWAKSRVSWCSGTARSPTTSRRRTCLPFSSSAVSATCGVSEGFWWRRAAALHDRSRLPGVAACRGERASRVNELGRA